MSSKASARSEQIQSTEHSPILAPKAAVLYLVAGEIKISTEPKYDCTVYVGTRAQLESEGLIASGVAWPLGCGRTSWNDGDFSFQLGRTRPDGYAGPRRGWLDCDCWKLSRRWLNSPTYYERQLKSKTKELRELLYRETPAWDAEFSRRYAAFYAAMEDERFQAFKALIPGLVPPPRKRRGRPATSESRSGRASERDHG